MSGWWCFKAKAFAGDRDGTPEIAYAWPASEVSLWASTPETSDQRGNSNASGTSDAKMVLCGGSDPGNTSRRVHLSEVFYTDDPNCVEAWIKTNGESRHP